MTCGGSWNCQRPPPGRSVGPPSQLWPPLSLAGRGATLARPRTLPDPGWVSFPACDDWLARRSPSPDRRRGRSLSPSNQQSSADASPSRRYVPSCSQPQFPPPKGLINGCYPQGGKKKKRNPPPPPREPCLATPMLEGSVATAGDGPPCFNYGLTSRWRVLTRRLATSARMPVTPPSSVLVDRCLSPKQVSTLHSVAAAALLPLPLHYAAGAV
ncbi:hypothetical protein ZWY2020_054387 [Hordeum vulgare]|nr:hypothetical protein ZWY2020_054387 [Hordeum vulgare]